MDKKTFIGELERSLSVLQEDELRDIIGEYEQHIDMKVKSGLTEEEAIADFGSLPELSAEILEAYHVRADYKGTEKEKGKKFSFADGEKAGKEILEQTGEICAKTGRKTVRGLRWVGAWLWGVLLFWKVQIARPFAWIGRKLEARRDEQAEIQAKVQIQELELDEMQDQMQNQVRTQGTRGGIHASGAAAVRRVSKVGAAGSGFVKSAASAFMGLAAGIFRFCWKAAGWCIRIAWNICWAGFSAFCGVMGLFCLFAFGMMVVLLAQGYPLAGVVIGCLGLNLCLFAAAGLGMTLLWRKEKESVKAEKLPEDEHTMELTVENQELEGREHA